MGRADELWRIHHALSLRRGGERAAALTGALEGGAGFGKTRLAAEYLHRFGATFYPGGLFWVRADLELDTQLHGMLSSLEPATPDLKTFMESGKDVHKELGRALGTVATDKAVLFVVDNVPEPALGEAPLPLSTWCPAIGKVALLITSRASQSLIGPAEALQVGVLAPGPAVALLTRNYTQRRRLTEVDWERIAGWVGYLPLALEILNASLRAPALEPRELLSKVDAAPVAELDRVADALRPVVPEGSVRGISEALKTSYQSLESDVQEAGRLIAHLGAAPVPLVLLEALIGEVAAPRLRLMLRSRSLVDEAGEEETDVLLLGRMHLVLADFLRSRAEDRRAELLRACKAVAGVMNPDRCRDPDSWPLMDACLPHAEELFTVARIAEIPGAAPAAIELGLAIGVLLRAQGQAVRAAEAERVALDVATASDEMGPDHAATLRAMNNLAETLHVMGDLGAARDLQGQVLAARRRLLGPDHPDTLEALNNLAVTLHVMGDLRSARSLFEQALEGRRLLGPDHPHTLEAMNNLAVTLRHLGDLPATRDLQWQLVDSSRRVFGEEHIHTLEAMNNLAVTLGHLGDLPAALTLQDTVLQARRRVLGPEHPATLVAMGNLAWVLYELGDLPAGRKLEEQVLDARRRLLGPEHPHTLTAMGNLAKTLSALSDFLSARKLQEQVLDARRRLLGREHPDTTLVAWGLVKSLLSLREKEAALSTFRSELGWLLDRDPATLAMAQREVTMELREWMGSDGGGYSQNENMDS